MHFSREIFTKGIYMIMPCQIVINHNPLDSVTIYDCNLFFLIKKSWKSEV